MEHAKLPPSSASRWGDQCAASAMLEAQFQDMVDPNAAKEAADGKAAHWAAAEALAGHTVIAGMAALNGVIVDDEMLEAAETYVDDVKSFLADVPFVELHIEETVKNEAIHPDNWGTPDLWWFIPKDLGGLLILYDFKFGHRFVDAFVNFQLINYVAKIVGRPEFLGLNHQQIKVILNVVQPRNYHPLGPIRRWETTLDKLHTYFEHLEESAKEALSGNARTRVGPECRDCKARHACEALQIAADNAMDISASAVPVELPPPALGVELRMLKRAQILLDARVTGLETLSLG